TLRAGATWLAKLLRSDYTDARQEARRRFGLIDRINFDVVGPEHPWSWHAVDFSGRKARNRTTIVLPHGLLTTAQPVEYLKAVTGSICDSRWLGAPCDWSWAEARGDLDRRDSVETSSGLIQDRLNAAPPEAADEYHSRTGHA